MTPLALRLPLRQFALPYWKKTDRRKRARWATLLGLAAVLGAHGWLAAMVETRRPEWRDPEFYHRQKRAAALVHWQKSRGESRPLVVILGGSRPQMGLSPEALNRVLGDGPTDPIAYNCAQSGCLPVGERLNLGRLFDAGLAPDYLLVEVLPPVLADPGPVDDRIPPVRLGYADLRRLQPYQASPERVRMEWARARLASWYSLRLPLMANWGLADYFPPGRSSPHHLWANMTFHGWMPFSPREWPAEQRTAQLNVARGTYSWLLDDFRIQPVNDRLYRDLLEECRIRGVRVALFTMPESPTFRSWYPAGVRQRVADYLRDLSRDFGVPVFDTSAWIDNELSFMDGHHLLGEAATAFSERFGKECVAPWLQRK
ncbi:MAG TPA: hypothetical protein VN641_06835 [Urbifossiella sp.]|nr:hypothetical protein [Urbifossiella sp.]